ncbi:MAG: 3-deoxy-manno-octulosonate cytidylyltransferase [Gemmataceae bacterium]
MKIAIVIPARYASTRLPGKPLLRQTGKYLIQHVYEQASEARRPSEVAVATDDPRIRAAVEGFGGRVIMTGRHHRSGTDRVAEAARQLDADIIINLQGDEPLVDPGALDHLADMMIKDAASQAATLAIPITDVETWRDPNCVKVVCDQQGKALYFSRSPIPWVRDNRPDFGAQPPVFLQHLGLYAYRRAFLQQLAATPPSPLEQLEKLEQLRILAMGQPIRVGVVREAAIGVDTFADYEHFVRTYRQQRRRVAA